MACTIFYYVKCFFPRKINIKLEANWVLCKATFDIRSLQAEIKVNRQIWCKRPLIHQYQIPLVS